MAKRIFITGAGGFIGSYLAAACQKRGDVVLGFDHFGSYYSPSYKRARVKAFEVPIVEGDILDLAHFTKTAEEFQPTHFVHLAAQPGVRGVEKSLYLRNNLEAFTHVLNFCKTVPEIKLLFASSSAVYGKESVIPFSEKAPCLHQASLYGSTKRTNELHAKAFHDLFNLSTTALRFFTVYGPWGRPDMAYFSFAKAILAGEPITLFGDGSLARDMTYIDDVIDATLAAIDLGAANEIFNIGSGEKSSLLLLVATLEKSLQKKALIRNLPAPDSEVASTLADITHAKSLLHYSPKVKLAEGIDYFTKWLMSKGLDLTAHDRTE